MTARGRYPLLQLVPGRAARLLERLGELVWTNGSELSVEVGPVNAEAVSPAQAKNQPFRPCPPGTYFAAAEDQWGQCWLRTLIPAAPPSAAGRRALWWDGRGEVTAYLDGTPWAGLDVAHRYCGLPDESCTLYLDCGLYQTAIWCPGPTPDQYGFRFDGAEVRLRDEAAWTAWHDWDALCQLMDRLLDEAGLGGSDRRSHRHKPPIESVSPVLRRLLRQLDCACDRFDSAGVAGLSAVVPAIFAAFRAEHWQPTAAVVGHAHLDLVWLWPEHVGRRKALHTFATVARLMDRYPEVTFVQTSPSLYEHAGRQAPELHRQIEARQAEGRWEATGALEVESDTLIPCGEALARCLAYGQLRFHQLRRGTTCSVAWLPDVFGYTAALPQILRLGGVKGFFTTKMTWSALTRFPHHSFIWRGPDGSEVITHLCPTGYNRALTVDDLASCARQYRQSDVHAEQLLPQGFGDGAGGPTEEMVERARRLANLAAVPKAKWTTVEGFFKRLESVREELPVYQGELYLECHRGTLTSQRRLKAAYRAAERAIQTHEAARALTRRGPIGFDRWQRLLFAQFHDALPGSSIGLVYEELTPELEELAARSLRSAAKEITRRGEGTSPLVFNQLPLRRRGMLELDSDLIGDATALRTSDGLVVPAQPAAEPGRVLTSVPLPALGTVGLEGAPAGDRAMASPVAASPRALDNGLVHAAFDSHGQLAVLDVEGGTLPLPGGAGFTLHVDHPVSWDAWDVDRHSLDMGRPAASHLELRLTETGPVRATLEGRAPLGEASELTVRYRLWAGVPYLFVEAEVDWQESHRLLRYEARTGSLAASARYGCPFGSLERAQVPVRDLEEAAWEVPGSRWAAVGDADQVGGLALITEASYGFSCRDGDLGVSLLRAPTDPDPTCDRGGHLLRFALGRYRATTEGTALSTAAAAEALFTPPVVTPTGRPSRPPFELDDLGSLVPCWVHPSETGAGLVLRLHEVAGRSGRATLRLPTPPRSIGLVDLLERPMGAPDPVRRQVFHLHYGPYQVLSVRMR